jgi:LmbE family N-acetylglucosaminyl deacetylase
MRKSVLAIGAHPDDIEIGCAGTLKRLAECGYDLAYVIVTSGEEGILNPDKAANAKRREAEAKAAAYILGVSTVMFLRESDGLTQVSNEAKIKLISILRDLRPEIVFTHAASDRFSDHRVVHDLTTAAVTVAQGPWYPDAGSHPFAVKTLLGYEVWTPIPKFQAAVDIGSTIEIKKEALRAHTSQIGHVNYVDAVEGLSLYRGAMSMTGRFAEVFEVEKGGFSL